MPSSGSLRGEQESFEVDKDRTRAWWTTVLAGQVDQSYPVMGADIKAHVDGETLVISGTVPAQDDKDDIEREVEHLKGNGVKDIRNEIEVKATTTDKKGLLVQTLVSVFENDEQAGFARGYLEGHAHVNPEGMRIVGPANAGRDHATVHGMLPEANWQDAEKALDDGRTLLIVTVDETEVFSARELLDEETPSLETTVLPPERSDGGSAERLRDADEPESADASESQERSQAGRDAALKQEGAVHGR
ncbi:MAG: BON domain-containing protein [Dehalococcoidia bacterium]